MTTPDFCDTNECSSHKECYFDTKVWPILEEMNENTNPNTDGRWIIEVRNYEYHLGGLKAVVDMVQNNLDNYREELALETGDCDEGEDPDECEFIRRLKEQVEASETAIRELNALPPMNA